MSSSFPKTPDDMVDPKSNQLALGDFAAIERDEIRRPASVEEAISETTGLEYEQDDEYSSASIVTPFDPTKIRMATQQMSLDIFIKRLTDNRIDLQPDFQREAGIWKDVSMSRLIESILIRIPLPAFYIDATNDDRWLVIDGLQRLTTLQRFVVEKSLRLKGLEFLGYDEKKQILYEGATYDQLPRNLQRRIEETQVTIYFVQEGTPPEVKYNIFKRINTGGAPLSSQEIRNALYQGQSTRLLRDLAESPIFKRATDNSVRTLRMADREIVLRFLAFALTSLEDYKTNDLDWFLNQTMESINKMTETEITELKQRFYRSMEAAQSIFGKYAFRKVFPNGRRGTVSKALFDTWSVNLDWLTDDEITLLGERREILMEAYIALLANTESEFYRAISYATGDPSRVRLRFELTQQIIREVLNAD